MTITEPKFATMATRDKLSLVADWLEAKQGADILALDMAGINSVTEAALIVSARSVRHAQALADHILDQARENNLEYLGMEGYKNGLWVLVDLNDVLVHVFKDDVRDAFNLEGLWADAEQVFLRADAASAGSPAGTDWEDEDDVF